MKKVTSCSACKPGNRYCLEHADHCEWNPDEDRACYYGEVHARSTVLVGARGEWRLCADCAALPAFQRFRVRKWIQRATP